MFRASIHVRRTSRRELDAKHTDAAAFSEARSLECGAFDAASSLADYHARLEATVQRLATATDADAPDPNPVSTIPKTDDNPIALSSPELSFERTSLGSFHGCVVIATGLTSTVYRWKDKAIKAISKGLPAPHNASREISILLRLKPPCVPMLNHFSLHGDSHHPDLDHAIVFPYMPWTLDALLSRSTSPIPRPQIVRIFVDLFRALQYLASQGIIHRDIKPSALLLQSPAGPAMLSDFGTAYCPGISDATEPPDAKVLDVGTGPYRAPECLFGHAAYGPEIDAWAAGTVLAEALCTPRPRPLFESRPAADDGSQLGLIRSIFSTLGSPTSETWPEATSYRTPPFEMYHPFPNRPWETILPGVDADLRDLIAGLVRYGGSRMSASQALNHPSLNDSPNGSLVRPVLD